MRKRYAVYILLTLFSLAVVVTLSGAAQAQTETEDTSPPERRFLITEVNLGSNDVFDEASGVPKEYVSITNTSDTAQSPTGLTIEYLKSPSDGSAITSICELFPWPAEELGNDYVVVTLDDQDSLEPGQMIRIERGLTNNRGGSLRLTEMVEGVLVHHDLVGWNRDDSQSLCFQQQPVDVGSSLVATRVQYFNHDFQNTAHNDDDFRPEFGPLVDVCANLDDLQRELPSGMEVNELGECTETQTETPSQCDMVRINEILPNPAGSDNGNEFIELLNTSDEMVELDGCALQIDDNSELPLDDFSLEPKQYRSFSDTELGFTLTNAAGGVVYLLSTTDEIEMVAYPAGLDDDQSYARFDEVDEPQWRASYSPTPAVANTFTEYLPCPTGQFRNPDTNRCNNVATNTDNELDDCGPGRYRHPTTNRCRNIESSSNELVPCDAGEYRSPETNRCRQVATTTSSLKPCAADQYRNPATNRCKKIDSGNTLVPCDEGEERNPETNRCRQVATVASATTGPAGQTTNAESDAPQPSSINVPLVAAAALAAVGYGAYEYRQDIRAWVWRLKQRFNP